MHCRRTLMIMWFAGNLSAQSLDRAQEEFRRQQWAAAERECRAVLRGQPDNAAAQKLLGMVHVSQGQFRDAEAPLRRACELTPQDDLACYYLGRNLYAIGKYAESRTVLKRALRTSRQTDRVRTGLGLTYEALGRVEEASKYLEQAARGGSREALSEYGQFLFRQGRLEASIEVLRRAGNDQALERAKRQLAIGAKPASANSVTPVSFAVSELPMVVRSGGTGDKHQIETMNAGVAVFDYDDDGWPDIYVSNGATSPDLKKTSPGYSNRLFRNNRDGSFTDVTERAGVAGRGYSMGVAAADFDNDGHTDLFVTGVRENILYRNRGDGTFEDITAKAGLAAPGGWSVGAGWFDYDNDGKLDLFVVRYVVWDPATEPYCGERKPGYRNYCHPKHYGPLSSSLYRNMGDGTFRDVSAESGIAKHLGKGMGLAFGDYDNDGFQDVFVANDTMPNFLFHNRRDGTFEEVAAVQGVAFNGDGRADSTMGVDFRDYDNDGRDDIFTTALSNEGFTLFRNTEDAGFSETTQSAHIAAPSLPLAGWSTGLFDLNNDGLKDIFAANGHADNNTELISSTESRQSNVVFLNRGGGTFESQPLPGKAIHRGAAFGDLNRDGRVDVVVTRLDQSPQVLMNTTEPRSHWFEVHLRGHQSNRDGIGARVHLVTDAGEQWNTLTTSVGYGGSSEPVIHFGLGSTSTVILVEVRWPSGAQQRIERVAADQRLEIEEPLKP